MCQWLNSYVLGMVAIVSSAVLPPLSAGEIAQHFPALDSAPGQTGWRIVWAVERHVNRSEVLVIKEAYFRRAATGTEVKILGDSRLAEIFVPYNDGGRIYDITGYSFTLIDLSSADLGPVCLSPGRIYDRSGNLVDSGPVAIELHDDNARWRNAREMSRRGEELQIWSALDAANYRYIILYTFKDDGHISVRLGATAHNLYPDPSDYKTHLHTGCWRMNVDLGNQADNSVQLVRYVSAAGSAQARTVVEEFAGGQEGKVKWHPDEFSRVRVESRTAMNDHQPANRISYELTPVRTGNGRHYGVGEDFTQHDLWVTRVNPSAPEWRYRDLPSYINGQPLDGASVIWHQAAIMHPPRDEDFGRIGYDNYAGVATTAWAGFDLKPRNLSGRTPLYP
jgi:primary-amine oxidase